MVWDSSIDKWEKTCEAIKRLGGKSQGFTVVNKATEDKVIAVGKKIGMKLPDAFIQQVNVSDSLCSITLHGLRFSIIK